MTTIDKKKITNTSLTLILTQAKDNLLVHDYRIVAKAEGEEEKEYLAFSEFYKDPVPNPIGITVNGLKPNTVYEFDVYALDAFGNESKDRSEEHTSELQSRGHLVCRLLLEKKKKNEKQLSI